MSHAQPLGGRRDITRRKFIAGCVAVAVGAAAGIIGLPALDGSTFSIGSVQSDGWQALGQLADLVNGVPAGFPYVRRIKDGWIESMQTGIAYAITQDGRDVKVFANVCTHGGCRVTWHLERQSFVCPCHRGHFAVDGKVLAGQPQRPLEQLPSRVVAGQVQIYVDM